MTSPAPKATTSTQEEPKQFLGRVGKNLAIGIVGLPNVGKSTTFNILTKSSVLAANFPFATKKPNEGRAHIIDPRFEKICEAYKPKNRVNNFLRILDIAGLIDGASTGAGLGNQFLDNIRQVDAIYHMVRIFDDESVSHVEDSVDPVRDIKIINKELRLKDIDYLSAFMKTVERKKKGDKAMQAKYQFAEDTIAYLQEGHNIRDKHWNSIEVDYLRGFCLLTAKPQIFLLNLSENEYIKQKSKWLKKVILHIRSTTNELIIPFSAALETSLSKMDEQTAKDYLASLTKKPLKSALTKIVRSGFSALNLITFFTAGDPEVRAWTIQKGTAAVDAAAVIHSDIRDGFQSCTQISYSDFESNPDQKKLQSLGQINRRGKTYIVEDGDILYFLHNTRKAKKVVK